MASRSAKAEMKKGKAQVYNAQGSKAMEAAEDETGDFKKGGVAKKKRDHEKLKRGGAVHGEKMKHMAHKPRKSGGRTPYSSGHATSMPSEAGKTDSGHEGQRPEGG